MCLGLGKTEEFHVCDITVCTKYCDLASGIQPEWERVSKCSRPGAVLLIQKKNLHQ